MRLRPGRTPSPAATFAALLLAASALPAAPAPRPAPETAHAPSLSQVGLLVLSAIDRRPVKEAALEVRFPLQSSDILSQLYTDPVLHGTTDQHGAASLALPQLLDLTLRIDHPDYAPYLQHRSGMDTSPALLRPGLEWTGRVQLPVPPGSGEAAPATGEAKSLGTICASWTDSNTELDSTWKRCAQLDAVGGFTLRGLPSHPIRVRVEALASPPLVLEEVEPQAAGVLEVPPARWIRGQILSQDGIPVAEAQLEDAHGSTTQSQADGSFALPVAQLPAQLNITAMGFRRGQVTVRHQKRAEALEVRLTPGEQITGTVLDPTNAPVPAIELQLTHLREDGRRRTTLHQVTTRAGEFHFDLPAAGAYRLALSAEGYRRIRVPEFRVGQADVYSVGVIGLDTGAGVHGTLVNQVDGTPVAGSLIELIPQGTLPLAQIYQERALNTVTDAAGHFRFVGLVAGRYELRARHAGHAPALERFNLNAHEFKELEPRGVTPGVYFVGTVVDRQNQPLSGLLVRIFDPEQATLLPLAEEWTDDQGQIAPLRLEPGLYRVLVERHDQGQRRLLSQEIEVEAGRWQQSRTWRVGGVQVAVQFTEGSLPVEGGLVMLSELLDPQARRGKIIVEAPQARGGGKTGYGLPSTDITGEVDLAGRVQFQDVPPGVMRITFFGFDGSTIRRRVLVPDEPQADLQIELSGHSLTGTVQDSSGLPIEAAELYLLDDLGQRLQTLYTDAAGNFAVFSLEAGTYSIQAAAEGYTAAHLSGLLVGEQTSPVALVLGDQPEGTLRVELLHADQSPAAGIMVTLLTASGHMVRSLMSDPYGQREFERLPPGEYFLAWTDARAGTGVQAVRVGAGLAESQVRIVLGDGTSGRMHCAFDTCADARIDGVALYSEDGVDIAPYLTGISSAMRFSDSGHFSLGRLSPGQYQVTVWSGQETWQQTFRVAAQDGYREISLN